MVLLPAIWVIGAPDVESPTVQYFQGLCWLLLHILSRLVHCNTMLLVGLGMKRYLCADGGGEAKRAGKAETAAADAVQAGLAAASAAWLATSHLGSC